MPTCNPDTANTCIAPALANEEVTSLVRYCLSPKRRALSTPFDSLENGYVLKMEVSLFRTLLDNPYKVSTDEGIIAWMFSLEI